jgi:hypothetical protein
MPEEAANGSVGDAGLSPDRPRDRPRPLPWYLLTLPALPVLALWAGTARETRTLLPLWLAVWSVMAAIVLTAVLSIVQRDPRRSAVLGLSLVLAFQWFGHLPGLTGSVELAWTVLGTLIVLVMVVAVRAPGRALRIITLYLNIAGFALVLSNGIVVAVTRAPTVDQTADALVSDVEQTSHAGPAVWYLVPDRYPSPAALARLGIDVDDFVRDLRERGFELFAEAEANYPETVLSLGSVWSLDLLDPSLSPGHAFGLLEDPRIGRVFASAGYEYIHLGSWLDATATSRSASRTLTLQGASEFWAAWEAMSVMPYLQGLGMGAPQAINLRRHIEHAEHQLRRLHEIAQMQHERPIFVMAHLLLPHEPYVFRADGSVREGTPQSSLEGYRDQLTFLNNALVALIDDIRARNPEAVILIMADEGPFPADLGADVPASNGFPSLSSEDVEIKYSIFAALSDPDRPHDPDSKHPKTAVNIIRRIVGDVLSLPLPLVNDHQYIWTDANRTALVPMR